MKFKENSNLNEYIHGVPLTSQNPDLRVSPLNAEKAKIEAHEVLKHTSDDRKEKFKSSTECRTSCLRKDEETSKGVTNIDCPELKDIQGILVTTTENNAKIWPTFIPFYIVWNMFASYNLAQ